METLSDTKLIVLKSRREVGRFLEKVEKEGRFVEGNYKKQKKK